MPMSDHFIHFGIADMDRSTYITTITTCAQEITNQARADTYNAVRCRDQSMCWVMNLFEYLMTDVGAFAFGSDGQRSGLLPAEGVRVTLCCIIGIVIVQLAYIICFIYVK